MPLVFDVRVGVTAFENRAAPTVARIEVASVPAVHDLHSVAQCRQVKRDDEVEVSRHETDRKNTPFALIHDTAEALQERLTIEVVHENRPFVDAVARYVVEAADVVSARRTWHRFTVPHEPLIR